MANELLIFKSPIDAAEACGQAMFDAIGEARADRGIATVAVSGGSTPKIMFEWMALQPFDWRNVHLFWVDERCVPPTDEQSNYRMTKMALLDAIRLPETQVHRIMGELDPVKAAAMYAGEIAEVFALRGGELPVFDVLQRGMGGDSHTASLFPGEPAIADLTGITRALWVPKMNQHRVTLLRGVLERARLTVNLVTGQDKALPLDLVLNGAQDLMAHPAQISSARMQWYVDPLAAAKI